MITHSLPMRGRAGFRPLYRASSRCPSCDGANWHVGRSSTECAHCGTALPLAPADHLDAAGGH